MASYPQAGGDSAPYGQVPPGQPAGATQVIIQRAGGCPRCKAGEIVPEFTGCGILLAVLFFPIGILCCLAMRDYKCTNCRASF